MTIIRMDDVMVILNISSAVDGGCKICHSKARIIIIIVHSSFIFTYLLLF